MPCCDIRAFLFLDSLIAVIPERYVVGQIGQTLTISCVSSHDNSTLEWFQEKAIGTGGKTTVGFFSSNQSITFNVTHSCLGSIFYCTFENHPIYYNVFTELIVLKSKAKSLHKSYAYVCT